MNHYDEHTTLSALTNIKKQYKDEVSLKTSMNEVLSEAAKYLHANFAETFPPLGRFTFPSDSTGLPYILWYDGYVYSLGTAEIDKKNQSVFFLPFKHHLRNLLN